MLNQEQSSVGFQVVADSNPLAAGQYYAIQVIEEAVIDSITFMPGYKGDSTIEGQILPVNLYRPMRFSTLTLSSGKVIAERIV